MTDDRLCMSETEIEATAKRLASVSKRSAEIKLDDLSLDYLPETMETIRQREYVLRSKKISRSSVKNSNRGPSMWGMRRRGR